MPRRRTPIVDPRPENDRERELSRLAEASPATLDPNRLAAPSEGIASQGAIADRASAMEARLQEMTRAFRTPPSFMWRSGPSEGVRWTLDEIANMPTPGLMPAPPPTVIVTSTPPRQTRYIRTPSAEARRQRGIGARNERARIAAWLMLAFTDRQGRALFTPSVQDIAERISRMEQWAVWSQGTERAWRERAFDRNGTHRTADMVTNEAWESSTDIPW